MDVSTLYFAADRMDDVAARLRAHAGRLVSAAAAVRWQSPAGRACTGSVEEVAGQLAGCATRVDLLAEHTRTHARRLAHHR